MTLKVAYNAPTIIVKRALEVKEKIAVCAYQATFLRVQLMSAVIKASSSILSYPTVCSATFCATHAQMLPRKVAKNV
jgi:hypothetical protein